MSSVNATIPTGSQIVPPVRPRVSPYGYIPTEWICILFVVLFALSCLIHIGQAIYTCLWWLIGTAALAGVFEIVGWSGRLWSSTEPRAITPFLMQITTTILAPTPLIAANFIILGQIITRLGQQYSRLSAKWYTIIFLTCDIVALVVQAVGGARASIALQKNNDPEPGGHIMLGGIVFQLVAVCIYLCLAVEFLLRYHRDRPVRRVSYATKSSVLTRGIKLMILALALDGLFILIRSIYRTIELIDGWTGPIISNEVYFNVLDAAMIVLAMFTLNFLHPGFLLGKGQTWTAARVSSETNSKLELKNHKGTSTPRVSEV
ncbi:RTA1-domain-containing protein [Earliella scabrosa]|nr:RTA1-domain-containing protein [Earliella scabrosa]